VTRELRAGDRILRLGPGGDGPLLMGVVNTSPDSFSDGGRFATVDEQLALARSLVAAGASLLDVGGESGVTNTPPVVPAVEVERVAPLVARIVAELDVVVSVDTYKPAVAREAIAAGATMVNDVSGLRDPALAEVCALGGAALVIVHTRADPKEKLLDPHWDGRVVADAQAFLGERMALAEAAGLARSALVLDPGPDLGKTPAQTVEILRELDSFASFGRPLLLAVSRKDFLGVVTGRPPVQRDAATLAAVAHGLDAGADILRVHDVAAVADFVAVRAVLRGEASIPTHARLGDALRREPGGEGRRGR
jgi:dihydropteroate synthase